MKPAAHRRDTPALGMPIGRELPAVVKNENYALPAKHLKPMALGHAWTLISVGHLIKRRTNMGQRRNASGETILECEPLVTADVFKQANEVRSTK